jgi:prefoldin beta subunit
MDLTDQQKDMVIQFQTFQQQLQSIMIQKESIKLQTMEMDKALEELKSTNQEKAYKITGNIMIAKSVADLKKELEESKEMMDVKIKSLDKTEERINTKLKELQDKLRDIA